MPSLPAFRYHPDPLTTGSVARSPATCRCCGLATGFIYMGPVYAVEMLDASLCPWCIADGRAAKTFEACFVDPDMLRAADLDARIVDELAHRTPSYAGRQQEQWLVHCGDACTYQGEASVEEVRDMPADVRAAMEETATNQVDWATAARRYRPGGPLGIYKFGCLHCGQQFVASDCI